MGTYCKSIFGGSGIFNNTTGNCEKSGTNLPIEEDTAAQYPAEDRLIGRILLQVESYGEAWYVNPSNKRRYYMKDGATAYQMMRTFGLGITNEDLAQIPAERDSESMKLSSSVCVQNSLANRLKGKILLQVQQNGEAWYVHPDKCRRIYMQDGASAYNIMRYLSLGISNMDIAKIDTGSLGQ